MLLQRQGKNPTPPVPACEGQTRYRGPLVLGQIMQPLHVASNFGSFHKNSSAVRLKTKVRTPHPPHVSYRVECQESAPWHFFLCFMRRRR